MTVLERFLPSTLPTSRTSPQSADRNTPSREVLVAAWLLPFLVALIPQLVSIQLAPFAVLALLVTILRRARARAPDALDDNRAPDQKTAATAPHEAQQTA